MRWFLIPFVQQYASFSGRTTIREYWLYMLWLHGIMFSLLFTMYLHIWLAAGALIFFLVSIIPTLAITARRLHDAGYSGWWLLLLLIPTLGAVPLLIFVLLPGEVGANDFGADPNNQEIPQFGD